MIGYVYCTVTTDGCYYIGQHKKSKFNEKYFGSGLMLKGKEIDRCYMIDSADTIKELNDKEIYWIHKCVGKHGSNCINLCARASRGSQGILVNRHDNTLCYTDIDFFASEIKMCTATVMKWVYRFNEGSRGLKKFKGKNLKKQHKELIENWIYMPMSTYLKHYA